MLTQRDKLHCSTEPSSTFVFVPCQAVNSKACIFPRGLLRHFALHYFQVIQQRHVAPPRHGLRGLRPGPPGASLLRDWADAKTCVSGAGGSQECNLFEGIGSAVVWTPNARVSCLSWIPFGMLRPISGGSVPPSHGLRVADAESVLRRWSPSTPR